MTQICTHILLIFAWKTWEISHRLSAGLSTVRSSVPFEFLAFTPRPHHHELNRAWFLFPEESGKSSEEQKPDHTGTSCKVRSDRLPQPARLTMRSQEGWEANKELDSSFWASVGQGDQRKLCSDLRSQFCTSSVTLGKLFNLSGPFLDCKL